MGMALIVYAKMAKKTLVQIIQDFREGFAEKAENTYENIPNGFHDIR